MDPSEAKRLAQQCLPALQAKGVSEISAIANVTCRSIAGVWTGQGGIVGIEIQGEGGAAVTVVAKRIGSYKGCGAMALQDHWSYYNEVAFYQTDLPDRMCEAGVLCPRPLYVERSSSEGGDKRQGGQQPWDSERYDTLFKRFGVRHADGGEEKDQAVICMTELAGGSRYSSSHEKQVQGALTWLARLHALFWGQERVEAAVAQGISDQTGFWHFDNRQVEFSSSRTSGKYRLAARGIDARLKADTMLTLCHGDPKGANIIWDDDNRATMYDFQWFGKGPPSKDLVYFIATHALAGYGYDRAEEEQLLRFYHQELSDLLSKQGDTPPTFECLQDSYRLACFDYRRWQKGGFEWGNASLLEENAGYVWEKVCARGEPKSEEECTARIFECFPP